MTMSGGRSRPHDPDVTTFDVPRPRRVALSATWRAIVASGGRPDAESASVEGFDFDYQPDRAMTTVRRPTFRYTVRGVERPDGTTRIRVEKQGPPSMKPYSSGMHLFLLHVAVMAELTRAAPTGSIFLSYRRRDSADVTGRILDRLRQRFGSDAAFRDVDDIRPAADFRRAVNEALARAKVVVAIIGPRWAGDPRSRLEEPDDMVRIELESALARGLPILPVLVSGATMPAPNELPRPLLGLANLNALPVRPDPDFERDIDRLSEKLGALVGDQP